MLCLYFMFIQILFSLNTRNEFKWVFQKNLQIICYAWSLILVILIIILNTKIVVRYFR